MITYDLPTSLEIGGVGYPIRSDFRAILDILIAASDPELDDLGKAIVMLQIMFPDWEKIPPEHIEEACKKACDFIDCGKKDDGKPKPRMIDWEQDASLIVPAVNGVAHTEVRALPYLHWWTFFGYFMGIGDSLLSSVIHIRQKKAKGKKLEKWEREFYQENKALCDIQKRYTAEEIEARENILKWL